VCEKRILTEGGIFGTGFLANKIYEIKVTIPEKASSKERVEKKLNDLRELLRKRSATRERAILEKKPDLSEPSLQSVRSEKRRSGIPSFTDWMNTDSAISEENSIYESPQVEGLSFAEELIRHSESLTAPPSPHPDRVRRDEPSAGLLKLESRLVQEGMSSDYVRSLVDETRLHLSPLERSKYATILEAFTEVFSSHIRVDSDLFSGNGKGKRKVVFFIGPTGSGKTTTLAKLAAKYNLHMGKSVSLYTTDNYRIAAIEQLKRYADTMDLPFYSVKEIRRFREALLRDGSELVLVDTAGYSHRDREALNRMKEFYSALGDRDTLENILVLSATVSRPNAEQVFQAYNDLGYTRVILSKLDEADYLGYFAELADIQSKEFAYLCVGQDVPFDILGAEKKLLAECVAYPEKMKGIKGEIFSKKS